MAEHICISCQRYFIDISKFNRHTKSTLCKVSYEGFDIDKLKRTAHFFQKSVQNESKHFKDLCSEELKDLVL
eukprot:Pgem_evm1s6264